MSAPRRGEGPQLAVDTCARRLHALEVDAPGAITWHGPAAVAPDRPASEATIQALCGLMAVHGRDRRTPRRLEIEPRRLGIEVASVAAGLLAASGRLAGATAAIEGRPVRETHTSVLQAGLLLLTHYVVVATGLDDAVPGPPLPAPGPPFRSADGHWFEIETLDAEPWKAFWARLGAGDADLGAGWTAFRWRYERAACALPVGLHEATAALPLAALRQAADETGVSLVPVRLSPSVDGGDAPVIRLHRPGEHGTPDPPATGDDLPLAGTRVVEATSRIQGPFAGMLLRMLGADVTRIQPPEGDYGRAALGLHRRKAAVRVDLGRPSGRAELNDLLAGADVFLHNLRPGKAAEWGLAVEDLAPRHPGLVYASASGWGDRPVSNRLLGTDFLVQADAGLGAGLHPEDEPPFPSRIILCDLFGALVTAEAVLGALCQRARAGGAWEVRSSLLAGATALQAHVVEGMVSGKEVGRRHGRPVWGALDQPVATAEGMVAMTVDDDAGFDRLCRLCGVDPAAPRAVVEERVATCMGPGTAAAWEARLNDAGIPAAVVSEDLAALPADPRLAGLFEPIGAGAMAPRSPWSFV